MPDEKYIEELWIAIKADIRNLQKNFIEATTRIKGFSGKVTAISGQMKKVGTAVTAVSTAVAGLGALAVKTFADFEQSLANTFSVLGATSSEMDKLTKFARRMGATTVFTASQAADAMYFLASAGFDTNQTMSSLEGTLQLAAATQSELADTTRIVVSTLNAYNLRAEEATRVSNAFSAIISSSQATMDKLGQSMKFIAPIAAGLNIRLEETVAALGLLFDAGLESSQAGTNLRQTFIRLQKPTKQAVEALKSMGLSIEDVSPQFHDLAGIIENFQKVGADAIEMGDELATIFGARAVTAMQVLIRAGAPALQAMETSITGTEKAAEMAKTQLDTLRGSMRLLISAAQEVAISIGDTVGGVIRDLIDMLKTFADFFNALPDTLKRVIIILPAVGAALGLIAGPIILMISQLPKLISFWKAFSVLMGTTGGTLALVVGGVAALTAILLKLATEEQRRNKRIQDGIEKMQDYNRAQIKSKEGALSLAEQFIMLNDKVNKSVNEQLKLEGLYLQITKRYPDLIKGAEDYETAVINIKDSASELNNELVILFERQKRLKELEVTLNLSQAKLELQELRSELEDTTFDDFLDFMTTARQVITGVEGELRKNIKTLVLLEDQFAKVGSEVSISASQIDNKLTEAFKNGQITAQDLTDDVANLNEIQQKLLETSTKLEAQKNRAEAGEEDFTKQDEIRLNNANHYIDALGVIIGKYIDAGKEIVAVQAQIDKVTSLEEQQAKLAEMTVEEFRNQGKEKEKLHKAQVDVNALTEEELALRKAIAEFERNASNQVISEKIKALKFANVSTKKLALQNVEEEFSLRKQLNKRELEDEIAKANEIGASIIDVKKIYAQRDIALEREKQDEIDKINSEYQQKDEERERRKHEFESFQNEAGLENYITFLERKLLLTEKYSEDWIAIMNEMKAIEDELFESRYAFYRDLAENTLGSIASGWRRMWDEVIQKGDLAKLKIKTFFTQLGIAFAQMLVDMTAKLLSQKLLLAFLDLISGGVGGKLTSAIVDVPAGTLDLGDATSASGVADTGAKIKKSGFLKAKAGEIIAPAELVRRNENEYNNAMSGNNITNEQIEPKIVEKHYHFHNPMVDDEGFWQSIVEDQIAIAEEKRSDRTGE